MLKGKTAAALSGARTWRGNRALDLLLITSVVPPKIQSAEHLDNLIRLN